MNALQKNELLKRTARASILSKNAVYYVLINGYQGKWTENPDLAEIYIRHKALSFMPKCATAN